MKTFLPFIAAAIMLAVPVHAQERSAGQSYDAQTNWSALNGKIEAVINQNKILATTLDKLNTCNGKKMLYAPADKAADANGCIAAGPSPADLKTHTNLLCKRGGSYQVVADCAPGEKLLTCVGGPGDLNETGEYWVLQPDFQNRRCVGYLGSPACYYGDLYDHHKHPGITRDNAYYSQTIVSAICY